MAESFHFGLLASSVDQEPANVMHPVVQNWFFAREMCRRLGFPAEHLFLGVHPAETPRFKHGTVIGLVIKVDDRELEWLIGVVEESPQVVAARYDAEWLPAWNANRVDPDMQGYWSSWAITFAIPLTLKIQREGIQIPKKNPDDLRR